MEGARRWVLVDVDQRPHLETGRGEHRGRGSQRPRRSAGGPCPRCWRRRRTCRGGSRGPRRRPGSVSTTSSVARSRPARSTRAHSAKASRTMSASPWYRTFHAKTWSTLPSSSGSSVKGARCVSIGRPSASAATAQLREPGGAGVDRDHVESGARRTPARGDRSRCRRRAHAARRAPSARERARRPSVPGRSSGRACPLCPSRDPTTRGRCRAAVPSRPNVRPDGIPIFGGHRPSGADSDGAMTTVMVFRARPVEVKAVAIRPGAHRSVER